MKEIEVKARIHDREKLLSKLSALGCHFSSPIAQMDRIFIPDGIAIPVPKGINVLRIREQTNKILLTLKQPVTNQLDCIEKELEIGDSQMMAEIIKLLGFVESVSVEKKRQKARYQDMEICIDEVTGLGSFIEVEKLSDGDGPTIQADLFTFLESIGIKKSDQEVMGYDVLLAQKRA